QTAKVTILRGEKPLLALRQRPDEHQHHPQTKQNHRQPQRTDHVHKAMNALHPRPSPSLAQSVRTLRHLRLNYGLNVHLPKSLTLHISRFPRTLSGSTSHLADLINSMKAFFSAPTAASSPKSLKNHISAPRGTIAATIRCFGPVISTKF